MPTSRAERVRARLGDEAGITIVEAIVAAVILLIGLMAAFLALDSASGAAKTAERQAIAAAVGERQIERLQAVDWDALVMCQGVTHSADPKSPRHHVNPSDSSRFIVKQDFRNASSGPLAGTKPQGEPLVVNTGMGACTHSRTDAVHPGPVPFQSGSVTGSYWRFITWRDDTCDPTYPTLPGQLNSVLDGATGLVTGLLTRIQDRINTGVNAWCIQEQDAKRITVAVVVDKAGEFGPHKPTWLSAIQTNVEDGLIIDRNGIFDFN